jgi:hypothetical protein
MRSTRVRIVDNRAWRDPHTNLEYYYQETVSSPKIYVDTVTLRGSVDDDYSLGKTLEQGAIPKIIQAQIDAGNLPEDNTGLYIVLPAGDVQESIVLDSMHYVYGAGRSDTFNC